MILYHITNNGILSLFRMYLVIQRIFTSLILCNIIRNVVHSSAALIFHCYFWKTDTAIKKKHLGYPRPRFLYRSVVTPRDRPNVIFAIRKSGTFDS